MDLKGLAESKSVSFPVPPDPVAAVLTLCFAVQGYIVSHSETKGQGYMSLPTHRDIITGSETTPLFCRLVPGPRTGLTWLPGPKDLLYLWKSELKF